MLDSLSSWIKQIILVVMFTTFVDFLIPNNKFLRYAKVLLGLVVMITIINPLLTFLNKENYFSEFQWQYNKQLVDQEDMLKRVEAFDEKNNELIIKQYKSNLISLITNHIDETSIFEVKDIDLKITEQKERSDFGRVDEVYILLRPTSAPVKDKKDIQKVSVKIEEFDGNKNEGKVDLINYKQSLSELKEYLQKQFNIPEKNIKLQLEGN
jgi:stage III sporulation protein AF